MIIISTFDTHNLLSFMCVFFIPIPFYFIAMHSCYILYFFPSSFLQCFDQFPAHLIAPHHLPGYFLSHCLVWTFPFKVVHSPSSLTNNGPCHEKCWSERNVRYETYDWYYHIVIIEVLPNLHIYCIVGLLRHWS